MTLDEYLALQQRLSEEVLVEHQSMEIDPVEHRLMVSSQLVKEHHPIDPTVLPTLRKIWTRQYDQYEANQLTQSRFNYRGMVGPMARRRSSIFSAITRKRNTDNQNAVIRRTK